MNLADGMKGSTIDGTNTLDTVLFHQFDTPFICDVNHEKGDFLNLWHDVQANNSSFGLCFSAQSL